ncbi:MAG: UDP-N-acetylglucosamine 2-epimerase (non-hydrolyzing) [Deltaproteobacteria bacterium]|nr:MAG: UDP-N-acetylglucosamine 2-epimerase (non-hydrolyzing) [Deltaproteobacteria bacterium]
MGNRNLHILLVAGARPNFMKVAPVRHALDARVEPSRKRGIDLRVSIVHTGQHYDANMSDVFFRELGIPAPDRHLEVGSGSHAEQTARIMVAFEKALLDDRPDLVVVVGDVNSTVACALTAKKMGIRVAHVEAGLRSFDMGMPEEINRKLTDAISDLLFVTEESGSANLRAEGIPADRIFTVGNVMIDTLVRNLARLESGEFVPSEPLREFCAPGRKYAVLTLHRPSNVDRVEIFLPLWRAIVEIARTAPILFPVHPRTRARIAATGWVPPASGALRLLDPLPYVETLSLVDRAGLVITDSGGLQEETTYLGVPCLTVRPTTERPVTCEQGTNRLVAAERGAILVAAREALAAGRPAPRAIERWDGRTALRILASAWGSACWWATGQAWASGSAAASASGSACTPTSAIPSSSGF